MDHWLNVGIKGSAIWPTVETVIDAGHRQHPAAQQYGNLVGVDLIVLRLTPVDGLHVEGMAEDKGDLLSGAEISQPVPGEDTFDGDHEIVPVRRDNAEKRLGARAHVSVNEHGAALVQDTAVHGPRVQVDSTVVAMRLGIESHWGLLL
jgi:hypothetical protein